MTVLVASVYDEMLRCLYALSTRGWSEALREIALLGLAATLVIAAWRLRER